jgi:hypothetical protein
MSPHASSVVTMSLAREPEPLPAGSQVEPAESSWAQAADSRRRPLEVAQCSLCGIALPLGLLVPDGGQACADVRWYCKDAKGCTERWTTAGPPVRAYVPPTPGHAFGGAGEAPAGTPAERLVGLPAQEQSVA